MYIYIYGFNIHGTHLTAKNSTNNNVVFFFVSDLKIVSYNNNLSLIAMPTDKMKKKKNETKFLPSRGPVDTAIWIHYMDAN